MEKIGIIGHGVVGDAVSFAFRHKHEIMIYDKNGEYDSLNDVIRNSQYIFICLPSPNYNDSVQDLTEINELISHINDTTKDSKEIILKSSILPGTTRSYAEKYPYHNFIFNPEFLMDRTARYDFTNPSRIILGGEDVAGIYKIYNRRFRHVPIHITEWESAELVKYMNNCYYAYKISFLNEFRLISESLGIDFNELRTLWLSDRCISSSYSEVPGPDGKYGYGGKCFNKDIKAFISFCRENDLDIKSMLTSESINRKVRYTK